MTLAIVIFFTLRLMGLLNFSRVSCGRHKLIEWALSGKLGMAVKFVFLEDNC